MDQIKATQYTSEAEQHRRVANPYQRAQTPNRHAVHHFIGGRARHSSRENMHRVAAPY